MTPQQLNYLVNIALAFVLGVATTLTLMSLRARHAHPMIPGQTVVRSRCMGCGAVHLGDQHDAELWGLMHECKAVRA